MREKIRPLVLVLLLILTASTVSAAVQFDIQGKASVFRAADGDTLILTGVEDRHYWALKKRSGDQRHFWDKYRSVKVRIGNLMVEESSHKDKRRNTAFGRQVAGYVKDLMEGRSVNYRCWDIGDYGRPICSVSFSGTDLGIHLIERGMGRYGTGYGPHPYLHSQYQRAAKAGAR